MNIQPCPFSISDVDAVIKNLLNNIASSSNTLTKLDTQNSRIAMLGAVIAAPALPNNYFSQSYYYYWTRDGSIVMNTIADLYVTCEDHEKKALYKEILINYLNFIEKTQSEKPLNNVNVLGEPKFEVDGSLWTGAWGRPQIDGAAYQILALVKIATIFLDEGKNKDIVEKIYNANPTSLLKANLEYCANNWSAKSFNMWEELHGNHFSVYYVQRAALTKGATLAARLNDIAAATYYSDKANHIVDLIRAHWSESLGYYFESLHEENQLGGGIDSSVLIALYYGQLDNIHDEFSLLTPRVLSTTFYIRNVFENLYKINVLNRLSGQKTGTLIGRYESDIYDGNQSVYGNPWFLCSNLLAASYYSIARQLLLGKKITVDFSVQQFLNQIAPSLVLKNNEVIELQHPSFSTLIQAILLEADGILSLVKKHAITYPDGSGLHMSEQIHRATGRQISALDLSWSYSSLLSAVNERNQAVSMLST